jgi:poly(A) polymerase
VDSIVTPEQLNPPPLVTGEDLPALGIPQGPEYRILLQKIRAMQLDGEISTLEDAKEILKKQPQS